MSEQPKTIIVEHKLIKPEPKLEKPLDKTEKEDAENLHALWFEDFKQDLAEKMPKLKDKILACESGYEIETVLEAEKDRKADNVQPKKSIAGKAKLLSQPDYTNSLTQAQSEGSLINRLYRLAQKRYIKSDAEQLKQKQIAKEKIDKMFKSLTTNPNLGKKVKSIGDSLSDYATCPRCGEVVEGFNPNFKGSKCPSCGFVVGEGSYTRKVW